MQAAPGFMSTARRRMRRGVFGHSASFGEPSVGRKRSSAGGYGRCLHRAPQVRTILCKLHKANLPGD
jgi:hypothetical protein